MELGTKVITTHNREGVVTGIAQEVGDTAGNWRRFRVRYKRFRLFAPREEWVSRYSLYEIISQ